MSSNKMKKKKLHEVLKAAHTLDKFDKGLDKLKKAKQITAIQYKTIKNILKKEHQYLSSKLEAA